MEVVLIGCGEGWRKAPLKDRGATTWGVNDVVAKRAVDASFWMDHEQCKDMNCGKLVMNAVNHSDTPTYCIKKYDEIPSSIEYPLQDLTEYFGTDYFADSCCYMIALAIYKGYDEISLYGFNYSWGTTYTSERPCIEFWLSIAASKGVKINIFGNSDLLKTKNGLLYAYGISQRKFKGLVKSEFKENKSSPSKFTVELGILDRMNLIDILPKRSSGEGFKAIRDLKKNVKIGQAEAKSINLRQAPEMNGIPASMMWDMNDQMPKKVELTREMLSIIFEAMDGLDKSEMIDETNIDFYEKVQSWH